MAFIDHNGDYVDSAEAILSAENRAFNYGDSIFETVQVNDGQIMFWEDHFNRLSHALSVMDMQLPVFVDWEFLYNSILKLAEKNECLQSSRIKVNVYREGEGRYTPDGRDAAYIIRAYPRTKPESEDFIDDMSVSLFDEVRKPIHPISNFKNGSSMIYILAGLHAKKSGFDDALITNTDGYIVDAVNSSVFIVKNGTVVTSPVEIGCIDGVMRRQVIKVCKEIGISIEIKPVSPDEVADADELFMTNVIQIIKSAKSFNGRGMGSEIGKKIYEGLLRMFFMPRA